MSLKLYHQTLCPYSRKIRLALREKNLVCELIDTRPWERLDTFMDINAAGEVPVLVDGDRTVCDSLVIGAYLEETCPDPPLFGRTLEDRIEIYRLVAWFDSKFAREVTDLLWRERVIRTWKRDGWPRSELMRSAAERIRFHLAYIDYLFESRKWLAGNEMSMADLAAAGHLSVLDYLGDVPWDRAQGARDWYAKMKSRPSMRTILLERVIGMKPPEHYDDPDF